MNTNTPTWWLDWSQLGLILLSENQIPELLAFAKENNFYVVDSKIYHETPLSISQIIHAGFRLDCHFLILPAEKVTEADIETINQAIAINSTRLVFVGENKLLLPLLI